MTLTLDLPPELDSQLKELARAEGMTLETYLARLLAEAVNTRPTQDAAALLRAWEEEDATADPGELACRQREWEAFKAALNAAHSSDRVLFP